MIFLHVILLVHYLFYIILQADQVNSLLEYLNIQVQSDIGLYDVVEVKGEWKKGAFDLDCAVYVMVHMLMFDGSNEPESPYLVDVSF